RGWVGAGADEARFAGQFRPKRLANAFPYGPGERQQAVAGGSAGVVEGERVLGRDARPGRACLGLAMALAEAGLLDEPRGRHLHPAVVGRVTGNPDAGARDGARDAFQRGEALAVENRVEEEGADAPGVRVV